MPYIGSFTTSRSLGVGGRPFLYGQSANDPATSAKILKNLRPSLPSGEYYFSTPGGVYLLYADMTTDGGGWTRWARTTTTNDGAFNIRSDYGVSGGVASSNYCALTYKNARDSQSSTSECEYLISMNNGTYVFKISTLFQKGTNNYTNRSATYLAGSGTMDFYMTQSELNSLAVQYWEGVSGNYSRGDVGQACKTMELSVSSNSNNFNIGQYSFRTGGSGSRCSDWCGQAGSVGINKRLVPYMERSETCFSGYSAGVTNSVSITSCEVFFREK
jgi:hypothetical protein